ncbi:neutrophil antibiotic peptide NP-1-like [Antechinus flavipes]|uniref:neutrophil antibiotic peptide NP-1-like n=1 Tax=Antechinus flavipes TaxID=38775 RepID=UPI002235FD78|nr:neutrophil antibiotic peptide NP-1-like [Antechinus flavipes]
MKICFLLIAVVFMTIQAQPQRSEEEMPSQEEAVAESQFPEAEGSDIVASDAQQRKILTCYCRRHCIFLEKLSGSCRIDGIYYRLCCR